MRFHPTLLLVGSIGLVWAGAAPGAELQPWDQEKVTGLATRLASAATEARRAARRDPSVATARDPRTRRFLDAMRRLERTTQQLATALQNGRGREETESIAIRIRGLVRDARQAAVGIPKSLQTQADIAPAEALLQQLAPFYFREGEPDPAAEEPTS